MAAGRTGTVLVVEDDPHVLLLLERLVTGAGYGVLSAGSGAEALAVLDGVRQQIWQLGRDISASRPHVFILRHRRGPRRAARALGGLTGREFPPAGAPSV